MLHRGDCTHLLFRTDESISLIRKPKHCATERRELAAWARAEGIPVARCASCDP